MLTDKKAGNEWKIGLGHIDPFSLFGSLRYILVLSIQELLLIPIV